MWIRNIIPLDDEDEGMNNNAQNIIVEPLNSTHVQMSSHADVL